MALDEDHFLVSESHLSSGIPWDVHSAEEYTIVWRYAQWVRAPHEFCLDGLMILFLYDIVNAVTMNEQILLKKNKTFKL